MQDQSINGRPACDERPGAACDASSQQKFARKRRAAATALSAVGLAIGVALFWRALRGYGPAELAAAIEAAPVERVLASAGFCGLSYLCLTGFDWLALRFAGAPLPWRRAALASFCALALAHNLSLSGLSSSAVRYRFYSRWGLSAEQVAKVVVFCGATIALGLTTLAGALFLLNVAQAAATAHLPAAALKAIALGCLAVPILYLALCGTLRSEVRIKGVTLRLPKPGLALAQIALGAANYACVVAALHQALAGVADVSYPQALVAYMAARVANAILRTPTGIGVTETVVQQLLPQHALIGPLLVFRLVHDLVPLALAAIAFAISEARRAAGLERARRVD